MTFQSKQHFFEPETFPARHIGPTEAEIQEMLGVLGLASLDALIQATIPNNIRRNEPLNLHGQQTEHEVLKELKGLAQQNCVFRSFIGMGYYDCYTPHVILRNVLENPAWYTQYTPYQAEIAQGRLETLLNFQTMVADLTGLSLANASLLDEATAAAEAMAMSFSARKNKSSKVYLVESNVFDHTFNVLQTRAKPLGISLKRFTQSNLPNHDDVFGMLLQLPGKNGEL